MAHAPILQDLRAVRAEGIVARQECELLDNGTWRVRDTATGSGKWHSVFNGHCTCYDYLQRGSFCKHLQAVTAEETALAQYGATWDAQVDEMCAASVQNLHTSCMEDLPGNLLDTDLNFADVSLTADDVDWLSDDVNRDVANNGYGADGWPEQRCPDCKAPLESHQYYVGGKGYTFVKVCTRDTAHQALAV